MITIRIAAPLGSATGGAPGRPGASGASHRRPRWGRAQPGAPNGDRRGKRWNMAHGPKKYIPRDPVVPS